MKYMGVRYYPWIAAILFVGAGLGLYTFAEPAWPRDTPAKTSSKGNSTMTAVATFGSGCFWGVEANFRAVKGVIDTSVGFMGGSLEKPSYRDVCTGDTGHAEVVQVTYDPEKVSYKDLLRVFWDNHDPTQHNRQGPDIGEQYRSVIFYYTAEQQQAAMASKEQLEKSGRYAHPIATQIVPAQTFWRAEEYHQRYLEKNNRAQCH